MSTNQIKPTLFHSECSECGTLFKVVLGKVGRKFGTIRVNRGTRIDQSDGPASGLFVDWFSINGKVYKLTWFDCPTCGHRYFVQVDDVKTEKVAREINRVLQSIDNKESHRFNNTAKQVKYVERLDGDLTRLRSGLEKALAGKSIIDKYNSLEYKIDFRHDV